MTSTQPPRGSHDATSGTEQFSVLLPVYHADQPEHLRLAFQSVTADQSLKPAQVVIVQDGPVGEDLAQAIRDLPRTTDIPTKLVRLEVNRGLALALNAGLEACDHDIVARQDADDVSAPDRFAVQIPLLSQGFSLVGGALQEFEHEADHDGVVRSQPQSQDEIARVARFKDPFNHPTVVYRKSAVASVGNYERLSLMEDYLLFARMLANGVKAVNVPDVVVRYRVGAGAYARRGGWAMLASEWRLQRTLRAEKFTTRGQFVRNTVMRAGYRIVPERLRRRAYRTFIVR